MKPIKIIAELGSDINVKSKLGKGSTFKVQVPKGLFVDSAHDFVAKNPVVSIYTSQET